MPVIFAIDRAGIIGEDGETHQGLFDLSYLRSIPNMTVMAPANENELQHMLYTAVNFREGPVAIRYPRDKVEGTGLSEPQLIPFGKGELLRRGEDLLIVAAGPLVNTAMDAAEQLFWRGIKTAVINARFIKPLDEELIVNWARKCNRVITLEENVLAGGFGSGVLELFERKGLCLPVKRLGIDDHFVGHGTRSQMLTYCNLDVDAIIKTVLAFTETKAAKGIT